MAAHKTSKTSVHSSASSATMEETVEPVFIPSWEQYKELLATNILGSLVSREMKYLSGAVNNQNGVFMITKARLVRADQYNTLILNDSVIIIEDPRTDHPFGSLTQTNADNDQQLHKSSSTKSVLIHKTSVLPSYPIWCPDWVMRKRMGDTTIVETFQNELERLSNSNISRLSLLFQLLPSYVSILGSYGKVLKLFTEERGTNCVTLALKHEKLGKLDKRIQTMKETILNMLMGKDVISTVTNAPTKHVTSPRSGSRPITIPDVRALDPRSRGISSHHKSQLHDMTTKSASEHPDDENTTSNNDSTTQLRDMGPVSGSGTNGDNGEVFVSISLSPTDNNNNNKK